MCKCRIYSSSLHIGTYGVQNISGMSSEGDKVCMTCNLAEGSDVMGCLLLLVNTSIGIVYSNISHGDHGNNGQTCFLVTHAGLYTLKAYDINLNNGGSLSKDPAYVWPWPVSVKLSQFYPPTSSPALPVPTGTATNGKATIGNMHPSTPNLTNCVDTTG